MLKYKVGEKVKIKPLEWFNLQKDFRNKITRSGVTFRSDMTYMCDQIYEITDIVDEVYVINNEYICSWAINDIDSAKLNNLPIPEVSSTSILCMSDAIESTVIDKPIELPKKRGRKPGSKNKPKVKVEIVDTKRKLTVGELMIGWNLSDKSDFQIGTYVGGAIDGIGLQVGSEVKSFKKAGLYSQDEVIKITTDISNKIKYMSSDLKELNNSIQSSIKEFEFKYKVKLIGFSNLTITK